MFGSGVNILFGGVAQTLGALQQQAVYSSGMYRQASVILECKGTAPEAAVWSSSNPGYRGAAVDTNHKLHLRHLTHTFHEWPLHTQVYNLQWSGVLVCS